jgi:hypothetical protein
MTSPVRPYPAAENSMLPSEVPVEEIHNDLIDLLRFGQIGIHEEGMPHAVPDM